MYASKQEMIDRFGQSELIRLTDRATPPAGVIDDAVLNAALLDADQVIDSFLQVRYALPLSSVPSLLKQVARDLARYFLYDDMPPEHVEARYRDAMKTLERIASGQQKLGLDEVGKTTSESNLPEVSGPVRVFGRDAMKEF
ncbi:MAG: DUF1320 domain-containing protein [Gammaproteobacteria bacterium]|nr:MAG: DUF1320 domain-containing protein [Gammaproteobacteria bacterium]